MRSIAHPVHLSHTLQPDPPFSANEWETLYRRAKLALPVLRRTALSQRTTAANAFERANADLVQTNVARIEAVLLSSRFEIKRPDYNIALQVVAAVERGPEPERAAKPQPQPAARKPRPKARPKFRRRIVRDVPGPRDLAAFKRKSESREDVTHHQHIDAHTGEARCDCEDYLYRGFRTGTCKHIRAAVALLQRHGGEV